MEKKKIWKNEGKKWKRPDPFQDEKSTADLSKLR